MPNVVPTVCPFCKKHISPIEKMGGENGIHGKGDDRYFVYQCTNKECEKCFVALYRQESFDLSYRYIPIPTNKKEEFSSIIMEISPNFEGIYNQAYSAEQDGLLEICGGGYRKALEFLIKDYIISITPELEADIKKQQLGPCINNYIDNSNIKNVSQRATWLGNDEIHYFRKWEEKDLQDLKSLIKLTINWIEIEVTTSQILLEMPK